ncbi:MAG: rhodanese-like domain-containing protein [Anaerolineae bacterium]|nr:rhodanese-like domain-containing protein [Anaerolineae bacterium]MBT7074023.1 rhodanese-like domain-containing protein [Anaerolineae bacterium]MBT7781703.1 rhodanese-like domain-containing protein [Anaerolineae bacterium]
MDILIALIIALLIVAIIRVRKKLNEIKSISLLDFLQRIQNGSEARDISPAKLQKILITKNDTPLIIDLREEDIYEKGHIDKALLMPFDNFMHEVLVEESYEKEKAMILICDHGLKSKVAADILGEDEGFSSVLSLRGGMEAWEKYK